MNKVGLTRNKALLIGVLACVLVFVLFQPPADPEADTEGANAVVGDSAAPPTSKRESSSTRPNSRAASWPDIALAETLAHNPFASLVPAEPSAPVAGVPAAVVAPSPPTNPPPESDSQHDADAEKQDAVAEFQRLGVTMILKNKSQTCAVVGGQLVHEGDIVNGVRIVTITSSEVIVEPVSEN